MWPLIDSHCHIDAAEFNKDRGQVLQRSAELGVTAIVLPGYLAGTWHRLLSLSASTVRPKLFPALGLHPLYVREHRTEDLLLLEQLLAEHSEVVAVGEIGLDKFVPELVAPVYWQRQLQLFEAQLVLAQQMDKPVIIHARRCHAEIVTSIRRVGFKCGGIVHAFSGSVEEAKLYATLGFCLGVGGAMTYASAKRIREVVRRMPLSALVLETDAPDMLPIVYQPGRQPDGDVRLRVRNSPEYLPSIFAAFAELRTEPLEQLYRALWDNTQRILRLPS